MNSDPCRLWKFWVRTLFKKKSLEFIIGKRVAMVWCRPHAFRAGTPTNCMKRENLQAWLQVFWAQAPARFTATPYIYASTALTRRTLLGHLTNTAEPQTHFQALSSPMHACIYLGCITWKTNTKGTWCIASPACGERVWNTCHQWLMPFQNLVVINQNFLRWNFSGHVQGLSGHNIICTHSINS
jgi:hypothetical protein